ncbi:MAG: DNA primase [Gammaproteobacteria bacterium]|nr:DNA primase [Gammaproteobacteria bacterium]
MAGRIPNDFIDDLVARTDIVDLIDRFVPLKRAGREYKACCPFHSEKTPSFTVSPDKQFYHCFGCGAHGTALGFLMEYQHMEFVEAVEELAHRAGLTVPREGGGEARPARHDDGPLFDIMEEAARYFRGQLRQAPKAVEYLKERGVTGETAARFGLGYAPPGWDGFVGTLGGDSQRLELAVKAGLANAKEGGRPYDRFRDRIIFPIRDRRGRIVGFGGRVMGDGEPKYLNSPETPVFHKGREVYGLHEARQANRSLERLVLVEGYMDVVTLAQHGILYATANLGTAATTEQIEALFKTAPELVFCFDGDDAGRRAAWRALENALPRMQEGRQARFAFLPEGEDPDSLVRTRGAAAFAARLDESATLSAFLLDSLAARTNLATPDGRAHLIDLARPYIAHLPPGALRRVVVDNLAERCRMASQQLDRVLQGRSAADHAPAQNFRAQRHSKKTPMRNLVTLLLRHPGLAAHVPERQAVRDLPVAGAAVLDAMLEFLEQSPQVSMGVVMEHFRDTETGVFLDKIARTMEPEPAGFDPQADFTGALARLMEEQQIQPLRQKIKAGTASEDELKQYQRALATAKGLTSRG